MLVPLMVGSAVTAVNLLVQVAALVVVIRYLNHKRTMGYVSGFMSDMRILGTVLLVLFAGHLVQIAVWGGLFVWLGEFTAFNAAFYHSAVNFASLGYGDIVMTPAWRLLGALEAANGVLMFSLSAASLFAVMQRLFSARA